MQGRCFSDFYFFPSYFQVNCHCAEEYSRIPVLYLPFPGPVNKNNIAMSAAVRNLRIGMYHPAKHPPHT